MSGVFVKVVGFRLFQSSQVCRCGQLPCHPGVGVSTCVERLTDIVLGSALATPSRSAMQGLGFRVLGALLELHG